MGFRPHRVAAIHPFYLHCFCGHYEPLTLDLLDDSRQADGCHQHGGGGRSKASYPASAFLGRERICDIDDDVPADYRDKYVVVRFTPG